MKSTSSSQTNTLEWIIVNTEFLVPNYEDLIKHH